MSRIIKIDSSGKQRTQLIKAVVLAIRELARQQEPANEARDMAAFIAEALQAISDGIDESVSAWEKRGYWIKADKFRMEWAWTGDMARKFKSAVIGQDWNNIPAYSAEIAKKFYRKKVSENHRMGKPWVGTFDLMTRKEP